MILTVSPLGRGAPPAPSLDWFRSLVRIAERGGLDAILFDGQWGPSSAFTLDPIPLIVALAEASARIGLAGAIEIDHAEPFNIARSFAAADRLTAGRSALIATTGSNRPGDFGHAPVRTAAERQARAIECLAVVRKLWDSWEDEAILIDKPNGRFSNPDHVHPINHAGTFFSVRGPLNAPRPLQGNPPVIQRDGSPQGLALARETADVFIAPDPSSLPAIRQALGDRPRLLAAMPFAGKPEAFVARLAELSPLCDGFDIVPTMLPTDLDLFVDEVVPLLRARGLRPAAYEGKTLREHLHLSRPRSQFAAARAAE
jgi:alkanesulfonate monooxygenase SsuD/methylene tetrahydromethanopterin reductase-like flavin-dependent oxidoreductase (luciferase family)